MEILKHYKTFANLDFEKRNDDDIFDKLSRKYSAIGMVLLTIVIGMQQFAGTPIECWCPGEFSEDRCAYATNYCFIKSQYVHTLNKTSFSSKTKLMSHEIVYYQWIPYIFLFQAVIFYAPFIIWRLLNSRSGFDVYNYIIELKKDENTEKTVAFIASHMASCIKYNRNYQERGLIKRLIFKIPKMKVIRNFYLISCHIFVKCVYVFGALLQIILLNYWLRDINSRYNFFDLLFGITKWKLIHRFPRIVFCRLEAYIMLSESQPHWMQCALPINLYVEKFYIIIWLWLWILIGLTICGILRILLFANSYGKNHYINLRLGENNEQMMSQVNIDSLYVLRLIESNVDSIASSSILKKLSEKLD